MHGLDHGQVQVLSHHSGNLGIQTMVGVFRPTIEAKGKTVSGIFPLSLGLG